MSDLFARPGAHRSDEGGLPALGCHRRLRQSEVGDNGGLVDVVSDLLGAALGGDVLGANERCPSTLS